VSLPSANARPRSATVDEAGSMLVPGIPGDSSGELWKTGMPEG
jgi:hypothetical protein